MSIPNMWEIKCSKPPTRWFKRAKTMGKWWFHQEIMNFMGLISDWWDPSWFTARWIERFLVHISIVYSWWKYLLYKQLDEHPPVVWGFMGQSWNVNGYEWIWHDMTYQLQLGLWGKKQKLPTNLWNVVKIEGVCNPRNREALSSKHQDIS